MSYEKIRALHELEVQKARDAGEEFFLDIPDAWYDRLTYGCENGHLSHRYLKSETRGALCLDCHKPIFILPSTYTSDDELKRALDVL